MSEKPKSKMDAVRERMGATESPEERAKRQKQLVLPNILSLSLSIAMVVIGYQVNNELQILGPPWDLSCEPLCWTAALKV